MILVPEGTTECNYGQIRDENAKGRSYFFSPLTRKKPAYILIFRYRIYVVHLLDNLSVSHSNKQIQFVRMEIRAESISVNNLYTQAHKH